MAKKAKKAATKCEGCTRQRRRIRELGAMLDEARFGSSVARFNAVFQECVDLRRQLAALTKANDVLMSQNARRSGHTIEPYRGPLVMSLGG